MTRSWISLLALLALSGSAAAQDAVAIDLVRIDKSERTLTLYAHDQPVRLYTAIQLGDEPVGAKRFQGDERTPEGHYTLDYGNSRSAYHLSLHISYPNAADQAAVEPIYEEMDGWSGTTAGARSWADLPAQAIKYIRRVEELIETPVALVSTSPEREDTILVRDPFVD